jgi:hypothetical protein
MEIEKSVKPQVVPFRNQPIIKKFRKFLCANCGQVGGTMVGIGGSYFHMGCKKVISEELLRKLEVINRGQEEKG